MDGDMRIALIGQSAFGESVLNALIERGESIVGVFTPPDREGRSADPMTSAASARGIRSCSSAGCVTGRLSMRSRTSTPTCA